MVPKKRKSKRQTCAKRYKIEGKVREKHRKDRREARKNGTVDAAGQRKKARKDPGIPSMWPFKEALLGEMEEVRMAKEAEKVTVREAAKAKRADASAMTDMLRNAERRGMAFELTADGGQRGADGVRDHVEGALSTRDNSRRAYYREFRKVVDAADVILQVLDARDPVGSRARHVEKFVTEHADKRLVLVVNKIDLVPREVAEKWLAHLRREFPTIPFKASTQSQRVNLGQASMPKIKGGSVESIASVSESLGADALIQLLKNYARDRGVKRTLRVGVVGYPNVGKSSVINSLKRSRVCQVGSQPGVTKVVSEVALDKSLRLLDCPGIVFEKDDVADPNNLGVLLRNCVKAELIDDPVAPVEAILQRCDAEQLMLIYTLPRFASSNEFLVALAQKRGKLKRGGIPDVEAAARVVLGDWNAGRIPFYTLPPVLVRTASDAAEIVQGWSTEFRMDDVVGKDGEVLNQGASRSNARPAMVVQATDGEGTVDVAGLAELMMASDDDDEDMSGENSEEDDEVAEGAAMDEDAAPMASRQVLMGRIKRIGRENRMVPIPTGDSASMEATDIMTPEEAAVNPQINRQRKQKQKQDKKKQSKNAQRRPTGGMEVDDTYDFGQFYQGGLPGQ